MRSKFLLAPKFKVIGWVMLLIFLALGILVYFFDFRIDALTIKPDTRSGNLFDNMVNFTDEIALTGIIVALLFISFAKERNEDEFINHTRLESWQAAIFINYILLLIAVWLIHGTRFLDVMMYNMLTIPLIFIIRFHYVLFRNRITEKGQQ